MSSLFKKCRDAYQHPSLTLVRQIIAAVVGGTVLLIGVALLVLPGPAFIVIPLGLAILASEFVWARHLLRKAKSMIWREKNSPVAAPASETSPSREEVTADKP